MSNEISRLRPSTPPTTTEPAGEVERLPPAGTGGSLGQAFIDGIDEVSPQEPSLDNGFGTKMDLSATLASYHLVGHESVVSGQQMDEALEMIADHGQITPQEYDLLKQSVDSLKSKGHLSRDAAYKWEALSLKMEGRQTALRGDELTSFLRGTHWSKPGTETSQPGYIRTDTSAGVAVDQLRHLEREGPARSAARVGQAIEFLADNERITRDEYELLKPQVEDLRARGLLSPDAEAKWDAFAAVMDERLTRPPSDIGPNGERLAGDTLIFGEDLQALLKDVRKASAPPLVPALPIKG